jgi:hypothetical protein
LISHRQARVLVARTLGGHALAVASGNRGVLVLHCKTDFEGVVSPTGEMRSFAVFSVTLENIHDFVDRMLGQASGQIGRAGTRAAVGPLVAGSLPGISGFVMVILPYWLLLLAAAPWVVLPIRRRLIRRRRKCKGLCENCGYDLRMSQGRCPECGTRTDSVAAVSVPRTAP